MRGDAAAHELVASGSLSEVLALIAAAPGQWTPIAGGTELMVTFSAGRLSSSRLVSLWGIPDLRFINATDESIAIGAGSTFTDIRADATIESEFSLLAKAASWIGAIANQSRATIGGNLVNGSPAADSSPALLAYDAEVEMVSVRGRRRIPYARFHTGYKQNEMAADELLYAVHLPRRFSEHRQYIRKVGTRRAMAVAKVALAGTALMQEGVVSEIRLAAASLAPYPARLLQTEETLIGHKIDPGRLRIARSAFLDEVQPIDDIRSNAAYRRCIGANLLEEFLISLSGATSAMNPVLAEWNTSDEATAMEAMIACCGARRWASEMVARRPISDLTSLSAIADHVWSTMGEPDWMEAFACHPRIGERTAQHASAQSAAWSMLEQSSTATRTAGSLTEVAEMNSLYEKRFGFTYIVCATGKSVEEMLSIVKRRLDNDRESEFREAAEQQRQIMQIRLRKWLAA